MKHIISRTPEFKINDEVIFMHEHRLFVGTVLAHKYGYDSICYLIADGTGGLCVVREENIGEKGDDILQYAKAAGWTIDL